MELVTLVSLARGCALCAFAGCYIGILYAASVLEIKNQTEAFKKLRKVQIVLISIIMLILIEFVLETIIRLF